MKRLLLLAVILSSLSLEAKVFRNAYVAFELPDTWKCDLEHTEWVCRSESVKESREAIIILTAKEVGPTDSFEAYSQHLATVQKNTPRPDASRVVYPPKQVKINDHVWIDGLHLGSEVVNYFTRYLATLKDRVAILVTYSAHKDYYTKYSQDFFKSIQSLRVIAAKNLLATPEAGALRPGSETLGAPIQSAMPQDIAGQEVGVPNSSGESGGKTQMLFLGLGILIVGGGLYVYLKMKKG
jgi:hypothetical protein